jgi:hypothetical protein
VKCIALVGLEPDHTQSDRIHALAWAHQGISIILFVAVPIDPLAA